MNPVVHFELPYENVERIAKFNKAVFGLKLTSLGEESGNCVLATTKKDAKPGMLAGAINGRFFFVKPDWPEQYPSIVIGIGNIQEAISSINLNGGKVLGEPMNIANFGNYVSFLDTEGNGNGIIEPRGCKMSLKGEERKSYKPDNYNSFSPHLIVHNVQKISGLVDYNLWD